jgi:hypothetical protein
MAAVPSGPSLDSTPHYAIIIIIIGAKLQWLQDPSKINGANLNNIRCEASRHFGNKKR